MSPQQIRFIVPTSCFNLSFLCSVLSLYVLYLSGIQAITLLPSVPVVSTNHPSAAKSHNPKHRLGLVISTLGPNAPQPLKHKYWLALVFCIKDVLRSLSTMLLLLASEHSHTVRY